LLSKGFFCASCTPLLIFTTRLPAERFAKPSTMIRLFRNSEPRTSMSHSNASPGTQGLLLVGHGTRDTAGQAEFLSVAAQLAERFPASAVEPCLLELCEPTTTQGSARCVQRGVQRLVVQPLLLFAAGHARRDIPEEIAKAARLYPDVQFPQAGHLGCHARIL